MAIHRGIAVALCLPLWAGCEDAQPAYYPPPPSEGAPAGSQQDVQIGVQGDAYADTDPSALTDFKPTLDPHGAWVDDPTYGAVWVPSQAEVGADFTPYATAGHWVYGDDYVWVSDYEWGWVPYHYGRWVFVDGTGWAWIPGRTYAGAWVEWRTGDDGYGYVGWAPMAPRYFWRGGVTVEFEAPPRERFIFCSRDDVFAPGMGGRIIAGDRAVEMEGRTHAYVTAGPEVGVSGHPFAQSAMHGPPPSSLGIDASRVPRPIGNERGLQNAQRFSRPSTAQPAGAHAATPHVVRPATRRSPTPMPMRNNRRR